jgi:hypothetical protein
MTSEHDMWFGICVQVYVHISVLLNYADGDDLTCVAATQDSHQSRLLG